MGRIAPAARSGASRSKELPISSRVFVGNLQYETSAQELETLFSQVGQVVEVVLPVDRMTDRPRGFAFVEFGDASAVAEAINRFDGTEFGGRMLQVSEARERRRGSSLPAGGGVDGDRPSRTRAAQGQRRGFRPQAGSTVRVRLGSGAGRSASAPATR